MSVFIDTGVFFAHHDRDAARHESATAALDTVLGGEFGQPYTSEYVFDETVTLTRTRTGRYDAAVTVGRRILGRGKYPSVVELLYVTESIFDATIETFEQYDDHTLSFTDANTITLLEEHEIDAVLSFDDDFDGIVERLDPTTLAD